MTSPLRDQKKYLGNTSALNYLNTGALADVHTNESFEAEHAELLAIWEDQMDALGSSPRVEDLQRVVDSAPSKSHPLYSFAVGVLFARAIPLEWIEKPPTKRARRGPGCEVRKRFDTQDLAILA